jgi:hypothetical protein
MALRKMDGLKQDSINLKSDWHNVGMDLKNAYGKAIANPHSFLRF